MALRLPIVLPSRRPASTATRGGRLNPGPLRTEIVITQALRVLQIEDSRSDAALIVRTLEKAGYDVYARRVEDAPEMRAALADQVWDVIVADYNLPQFGAPAALDILRDAGFDIPFIVVSGAVGEDLAVDMMKAGAHDYVMKNHLARLAPAVRREVQEARARHKSRQSEALLQAMEQRLEAQQDTLERQTRSLREKEALLREIHHRVGNNLQVVSSMLGLQARVSSNQETRRMLDEICTRIHSMALLHETLYRSDNTSLVDFSDYVARLAEHLFQSYNVSRDAIRLNATLHHVCLNLDAALPCALIINEVVSNSLKHAFPGGRAGEVRIVLDEKPRGAVSLLLADNGIGIGPATGPGASHSLGLRLVKLLARQLNATLEIGSVNGTQFRVAFPLDADAAVVDPCLAVGPAYS
jgi:two-component sensor histidine kinase